MATDIGVVRVCVDTDKELCKVQLCDENYIYGNFNKSSPSVPIVQEYGRVLHRFIDCFKV
jgi:hypothetical protein